jgi:hypothetical protein
MYKAITFLLFFFAVIALSLFTKSKTEGFVSFFGIDFGTQNDGTPNGLNTKNHGLPITQPLVPDLAEAGVGNIQPSPPLISQIPSAPFGARSKGVPQPYKDTSTEPAKYIQLLAVKEDLQAFFAFQAQGLETQSDPSVQIPLTRARADMSELIDVQSVLERNPGLPSRITNKQLDEIRANLRYLQAVLRDLEASGVVVTDIKETFADMTLATDEKRATKAQLDDFRMKLIAEIQRLSASGTSDPIVNARINTLMRIQADIDQVLEQLKTGQISPETIPIYASDIEKALPLLGDPTAPLPTLLHKTGLPSAIANLFPGGLSPQDSEQAAQINNIVKGYMNQLFDGTSWGLNLGVNLKYDSARALEIAKANHEEEGLPGIETRFAMEYEPSKKHVSFQSAGSTEFDIGLPGTSDRVMPTPQAGNLDWKQRALEITQQIKKRGIDPMVYGAMPENTEVSPEFQWKGYTKMICSRTMANADPGFSQSVGCPPSDWVGWRVG